MSLRERIRDGQVQYVALWALAILNFGLAAVDASVLGFDRSQLLLMAAVFVAVTAEYSRGRCWSETLG